jgi:hypothetical protein
MKDSFIKIPITINSPVNFLKRKNSIDVREEMDEERFLLL